MVTVKLDWMEVAALWELVQEKKRNGVEDELLKEVLDDLSVKFMEDIEDFDEIVA